MVIAELRNATKRFGPVTALAGIDLEIARGQLLALLGPNGAGKTTAVRLLLGKLGPASQSLFLGDRAHSCSADWSGGHRFAPENKDGLPP
jgi:ABC-2 type transport system ATP-binding protein